MKLKSFIQGIVICSIVVIIDQFIKYLVVKNMKIGQDIEVLGDVFTFHYLRNPGSAWGMLSNHTVLLIIISIFAMLVIGYVYNNISHSRYNSLRICLALILGGALGNLIDRIRMKEVIDYLYFKLINFPVFNFADICVTVPVFIMILLVIFKYNGDDFDVIMGDKILDDEGKYIEKHSRKGNASDT